MGKTFFFDKSPAKIINLLRRICLKEKQIKYMRPKSTVPFI